MSVIYLNYLFKKQWFNVVIFVVIAIDLINGGNSNFT